MFIGWFFGYVYFAVRMVHFSGWGYVTDFNAIFFWTSLFALISCVTFVPLTIVIFNKVTKGTYHKWFPVATTLVSQVALIILLLPFTALRPFDMGVSYFLYAAIIGFTFGSCYYIMQVNNFCGADDSKLKKTAVLIVPVAFILFLFNLFPYIAPSIAYKYFGGTIREKATKHVLQSFNPGDKITDLNAKLPGFGGSTTGSGSISGSGGAISYDIKYDNGIITNITVDNNE